MNNLYVFLEECKNNKNVNIEKGLANIIDLDYVIEKLEAIKEYEMKYTFDIINNIEGYIESILCHDSVDDKSKKFLESLSIENIKIIADKVMDDVLNEELNDIINYYVWEYKKGK